MVMVTLMAVTVAAVALLVVMVMVTLMAVTVAAMALLVVMVMVLVMVMTATAMMLFLRQILSSSVPAFHSLHDLVSGQLIPRRGDEGRNSIMLSEHRHSSIQLDLRDGIGTGQDDGGCGFNLVIVELTKVLHVYFYLAGVNHSYGIAQHHIFTRDFLHGGNHIGQLANAGGFDNNAIRMIPLNDLRQGLAEIAHQTAADAAGVHFGDLNAGILQKTAVNADLTEFILDEHQLFALIGLFNELFDQRGLASAQKAGKNVNFGHIFASFI